MIGDQSGNARAYITGGAGFLGSALVSYLLDNGYTVSVLDNFERGQRSFLPVSGRLTINRGDVRDLSTVRDTMRRANPTYVFHLAALHYIPACDEDPDRTWSINVDGTANVVRAAAEAGVPHFVFASTAAVYSPSLNPHHEDEEPGPVDIYGKSKLAGEELVTSHLADRHVEIARLFNIYGERETNPHIVPTILEQLRKGRTLELGRLDPERDYIFVSDVCRYLMGLAWSDRNGVATTNVGTGVGTSVRDLVRMVGDVLDVVPIIKADPKRVRPVDRPRLVANVGRLTERVPIDPVTIESGIVRVLSRRN